LNFSAARRSVVVIFALVASVLLAVLTAPAAVAVGFSVSPGATFNNPLGGNEAKWRILRKIEAAIDNTCQPACAPTAP
jgi:hypothetical protein